MRTSSRSTLHYPDLPGWHAEPGYSAAIAGALGEAYRYIQGHPNNLAAAHKAFAIAIPHVGESMCLQQRMNLHYILAQCAREMDEPRMALEMLDCARECATQLHDRRATAALLSISGNTRRVYMRPRAALADLRASRAILEDLKGSEIAAEPDLELSVVFAMAGVALFQARYEEALRLLDEAHRLHFASRNPDVERDRIAWMRAVNLRYLGRPDEAAPIFMDIASRIDAMPHPAVFTRLYTALADATLDLADRAKARGDDGVMRKLLSIAQIHAMEGMKRSDEEFDEGGAMLARLAIVRQSQFVEDSDTRRDILATIWRFAENTHEPDVRTRVRIALAREYVNQGDIPAAQNLLRQVTGRSAASEVPYTGEPAKTLLRRIGGYENW
jgi:tetratricopeptide (TPR) repeat protein